MTSCILLTPFRHLGLTSTLAAATLLSAPLLLHRQSAFVQPYTLETLSSPVSIPNSQRRSTSTQRRRPLNPRTVRQITTGSIIGVIGGLAVSVFSKPLAVILGLLVFGAQFLEMRGIHVVPYNRIQRYFKDVDIGSALQENAAFKLSFGATFALAAFASF